MCLSVQACASVYRRVPQCTDVCLSVQACASVYRRVPQCTDVCLSVQTYASVYRRVPQCTDAAAVSTDVVVSPVNLFRRVCVSVVLGHHYFCRRNLCASSLQNNHEPLLLNDEWTKRLSNWHFNLTSR